MEEERRFGDDHDYNANIHNIELSASGEGNIEEIREQIWWFKCISGRKQYSGQFCLDCAKIENKKR